MKSLPFVRFISDEVTQTRRRFVSQSLDVAHRVYILDNGAFVLQGRAADIRNDPDLKRAYLGM